MSDGYSPSYTSVTLQAIAVIWYDIARNPTRTISSMKVSMTRDITHNMCVYHLATWFNRRRVSQAATTIAYYWAPCLNIIVLLRIHAPVKDCFWRHHPLNISVLDNHCAGRQQVRKLTYSLRWDNLPSLSAAWRLECSCNSQYHNDIV